MKAGKHDEAAWRKARVRAVGRQATCELDGEIVILDLDSGTYYGLGEVGAVVWQAIQAGDATANLESLCRAVQARFEVEREACERDLIELLGELESAGLLEVHHAAPD